MLITQRKIEASYMNYMKEKIVITEGYFVKDNSYLLESAPLDYFYGKDVFITSGLGKNKSILFQMLGNLGAFANDYEFDNSISVFVLSDSLHYQLKNGFKDEVLVLLESKLNSKGQSLIDLLIITESSLIDFVKKRTSFYSDKVTQDLVNSLQRT